MPVIKIINRTSQPVSTSIGTVREGRGSQLSIPIDLVTKKLVEELEDFRSKSHIDFSVVNDPDIRDDIEQGITGFYTAVEDLFYFVDEIQGTDKNPGTSANAPYKTLQKAFNSIPKNINDFTVYIFLASGNYSGAIKGITTANNEYNPVPDPLSESYSFLYDSTRNGVVRIVGATVSDVDGVVTGATFNSLQDTTRIFIPGEHTGKTIRIINGPAAGEIALIKDNTADTFEVDFFFNAPEPGDNYEIARRTSIVDVEAVSCSGLILFDRCSINLKSRFVDKLGLINCGGSIDSRNSKINAVYHFMGPLNKVDLSTSVCDIGFGSLISGVKRQLVESFSIYSLINVKLQNCGVAGIHIGTQDFMDGFSIFARHASQVNLFEIDADDCQASFVVLVSSHSWISQSTIGAVVSLPNHILEGYLNSTYNDAGGNVFSSVDDNIKLETGSFAVDSGGEGGGGGGGVKIFVDEVELLAAIEDDGTIAYAQLEGSYFLRSFATWFEHFAPPAPPLTLVGQDLVLSGTTLYTAKIPSGLPASWSSLAPGQIITNLIVDNTFSLTSPDQANRFTAGTVAGGQASAGSLDLIEDNIVSETYDIAVNGIGTIGRISVTDLSIYNGIWQKANAAFSISLTTDGRNYFQMEHTEAGVTSESEVYYDDTNPSPVFTTPLAAVVNTAVPKWLSGIEALGAGTTVDIDYTAAFVYEKTYHPTAVATITGDGLASSIDNPVGVPAVIDSLTVSRQVTLDQVSQADLTPSIVVTARKTNGVTLQSSALLGTPLNTYGGTSTTKTDTFFDEVRRIILGSGTTSGTATSFDSTIPLVDGNAQQRHNGILQYPIIGDYPGFSGNQEYQRFMAKASASVGALTLDGISFGNIGPYGTGNLNVLLELAVEGKFFDFGRSIGDNNGTGSGDSRANSKGARNDGASSGSTLSWSIGIESTAFNNNEYRLIIIFRNNTYELSRIIES